MLEEKLTPPSGFDPETSAELLTPWYLPEARFEELPGVLCATDLLAAWQPDAVAPMSSTAPDASWDAYFSQNSVSDGPALSTPPSPSAEVWNPFAAASAVDCLFRFMHALEQANVDEAMLCVAQDYHLFENDIDMDRHALRMRLEQFVDEWRSDECRITLTEIPEPVFYPRGIVMQATIQVDYFHKIKQAVHTLLLAYLIRFDAEPGQEWLIHALHRTN
jgi:hypothetical protein